MHCIRQVVRAGRVVLLLVLVLRVRKKGFAFTQYTAFMEGVQYITQQRDVGTKSKQPDQDRPVPVAVLIRC